MNILYLHGYGSSGQSSTVEYLKKSLPDYYHIEVHYAAHGHTAAEVIYKRADAGKPFMGLTTFSGELPLSR